MEDFVSEEKNLILNLSWSREPVEVPKDRGDMVMGAGVSEQAGNREF